MDLSRKDSKCLKHPAFLKFVYKSYPKMFTNFLTGLSYEEEEFTFMSCKELIKIMDDIPNDDVELLKLFEAIFILLQVNDGYQLMRFEILIGFPQLIVSEPITPNYPFPSFSYHKIKDIDTKFIDYRGLFNNSNTSCLMKKIYSGLNPTLFIELFLQLLNSCTNNQSLLKYIFNMPHDTCRYDE